MSSEPFPSFNPAIDSFPAAGRDASSTRRLGERARRFEEAMRLMEDGCWHASFLALTELADAGHPQAARIALLFVRRGTSLFGGSFQASARQRESWQRASD
ncbi:hypothetical protein [Piscinibacter sp. XHJ-5]|uniref:hypothetical protein n=1 Tax=Piscinibacter sp. XHJ-5 TaxID=3037797 RepID=UPI002452CB61|nr:hypothetical protein [Piscinibacter sp. XHJ-5]